MAPNVYRVGTGGAGAFVLDGPSLTIVDAGLPGKQNRILASLRRIGKMPTDIKSILITHYHYDHIGGLTTLAEATRAKVYAPAGDAELIRNGGQAPPMDHRGVTGAILSKLKTAELSPCPVNFEVSGGDELDAVNGIKVIASPGHTPGHVSYLWAEHGGVLFVGDAASNLFGRLGIMPVNEDFVTAEKSFAALAQLDFEVAGFGHGMSISVQAGRRFSMAAERAGRRQ